MSDIIAIGDATEDVFVQLKEATVRKQGKKQILSLEFATKIPVDRVSKLIGGNAANVAIGARRLGMASAYYAVLGKDDQGERIKKALGKERVSLKYVQLKSGSKTNYSVALNHGPERTILVHHVPRTYKLPRLEKSQWIYYTSTGAGFERLHRPIIQYLKRQKAKMGFNPGTHQMRKGAKFLSPLLKKTEVLFLNKEETQLVTRSRSNDEKTLLKRSRALGPRIAVLTDGPNGSYAYDGKEFYYQKIYKVPVIERTGCGDSYSTGFLAALFHGRTWQEAMQWGTLNAASVIQQIGPQEGLARLSWMKKTLRTAKNFKPKKL